MKRSLLHSALLLCGMNARIDSVRVAGTHQGPVPVVLLSVTDDEAVLPIFIGFDEAAAIARGIDATDIGRPLTHDLLLDIVEELGGRIDRVEVSGIEDGTYLADLHLQRPMDTVTIDARPSDSLALAARTNVPIEIDQTVFNEGKRPAEEFADLADIRDIGGSE